MFLQRKKRVIEEGQDNKAALLSSINEKILLNKRINDNLQRQLKLIYDYWFIQFDFPDKNGKPYCSSGGAMVRNDKLKRKVPQGWKVTPLKGLYNIKRGISYNSSDIASNEGVPMINLACIDKQRNYRDGELKIYNGNVPDALFLDPWDLLIACTDLTRNCDIIGCPIFVPDDEKKYTYSMDIAKIEFSTDVLNTIYMYMTLRTDYYHNYIKAWASGTNVLHLNLEGLDWYNICVPPIDIQKQFAEIAMSFLKKQNEILSEIKQLTLLRNWLLPMLMNGQATIDD